MAINKQTIISAFDDKLTLLQWLKTINKALDEAVLTGVEVRQKGNATFSFVVTFEDGTELESNQFVLAQGESVNGAFIRNGHLYLTLTNDDELDAGNVKPVTSFEINASQHLIVNYGDGTSQDLGAIFSGNVNIDGTLNATKVTGNEIVETMSGYSFTPRYREDANFEYMYASVCKNGNKLTFVVFIAITPTQAINANTNIHLGDFIIPNDIYTNKLISYKVGNTSDVIGQGKTPLLYGLNYSYDCQFFLRKEGSSIISIHGYNSETLNIGTTYLIRIEQTFLLSDSMAC